MVQAFTGLFWSSGTEDSPPFRIGVPTLDVGSGMWSVIGILAALVRRAETGVGGVVDASLFETGLAWLKGHYASFRASGAVPERHRTGSNRVVPFQAFESKTGPLIVAAGNDRLFAKLAGVLGRPDWVKDPRFTTNAARVEHKTELCAMIDEIFLTRSKGEWIDLLEADGVPCAVINSLPEAAAHPQVAALDMIQPVPGDDFALVALPISFDGARPTIRRAPPAVGQHDPDLVRSGGRWPG
jgi:crotonobetainyl-CoA:carnitine CoA-transferase CaiB-like acyl-CoA transferase